MLTTTTRRIAATVAMTLVALLSGTAGIAVGAIFISVDSPLPGGLAEGDTVPAGRIARGSIDITFGHVPSDAECAQHFSNFVATVDWGDGTPVQSLTPTNIIGDGLDRCTFDLGGPEHRYVLARPEPYIITVSVSHEGTTGSGTREVRVIDVPFGGEAIAQTAVAGQPLTANLGEIRDDNDFSTIDQFSATIDWGDGSAPTPATLTLDRPGRYGVTGTHTYIAPGSYTLIIQVTHGGQTVPLDPATVTVVAGPGGPGGPAIIAPNTATLSEAFALRSSRARLSTLRRRGILLRIGLGDYTGRTIRLDVRGTRRGRVRTLGSTRLGLRGARLVNARTRTFDVRWRPSARLLRRLALRAGRSYGLRVRFGTTTLQDTLALRR